MSFRTKTRPPVSWLIERLAFALLAAPALFADSTVVLQNGVNGYSGARDAAINTQYAESNGGNGTQWRGYPELGCYTLTGTDAYSVRYLLKFADLTIPAGSRVVSATLALSLDSWISGGSVTGFYLKNDWNSDSKRLGWLHRDDTHDWAGEGASSPAVDTVAGAEFQLPAFQPVGTQTATIPLDRDLVQSWIDSPSTNQGIMLVNNNPDEVVRPGSASGEQRRRPKLTIVIADGVGGVQVSISPATANLRPDERQTFTATVTGASDTAVSWTASGGEISEEGVYTAGSDVGNFRVTATAAADSTQAASVGVTIQLVTPAVSVTISPASAILEPGQTQQFSANVVDSADTTVEWTATGGAISSSGLYTAENSDGAYFVTATAVADASKSATAPVVVNALPPIPRQSDGPYIRVQSPVTGMRFTAPATIRIYADPSDLGAPDPDALIVDFLLNGQSAGSFAGDKAQNGYWALTVKDLPAGTYSITAQFAASNGQLETSPAVTVFVDEPVPSSGPVFNLTADVVLTGSQSSSFAGTPTNRCTINGNGFQIRSAPGFTGSLRVTNCDIRGLGTASLPAIDVTTDGSGSIQLTANIFDTFGTVAIGTNGQAQAVVRNNEFRENTLVPVTSLPTDYVGETLPVFHATGQSTVRKFFQGNNVGLSTVQFDGVRNWLIGGDTDAESNVLMGVRCGFTVRGSTNIVLRGNYSQHNYPHRMSQASNFELQGDGFLAEHNVIRNSSWPIRSMGGELRYNLIDTGGNADQVVQGVRSGVKMHHNIFSFTVSQTTFGPGTGISLIYQVDNVQFFNNVMDGGGAFMQFAGTPISIADGSFMGSLRNNVFYNFASRINSPALTGSTGESTTPPPPRLRYSDYNDFFNPDSDNQTNYGLGVVGLEPGAAGYGLHDLGGFNGQMDPKFTQPSVLPFPFAPQDIWNRVKKVSDVLATYRSMYAPAPDSPLIGAGDPQDGAGGNIGAIGNGESTDHFGMFARQVSVSVSPASVALQAGAVQQFTATVIGVPNTAVTWKATGGAVTSAGLFTAGATPGSYTVTAILTEDTEKSASAAVTIFKSTLSAHPRMILDPPLLATLRSRMQANTEEWQKLRTICNSLVGGPVSFINGTDYPTRPAVGEGYQGSGYHDAIMSLGVCYQTALLSDRANAAKYGAQGVAILMAMSDPANQIANECNCPVQFRDWGYGIRFFGAAMGLGYDWFHDLLSPGQRTQIQNALNAWIVGFETGRPDPVSGVPQGNFQYEHPQGNYFAGYYWAKCVAGLAVQGDSPLGDTWWNAWYNHEHLGRVAPYYRANLAGGGWTEGYTQYGILATRNQSLPVLAVKTAKGIDLINASEPLSSYTYPVDNPRWLMAFTWPTRDMIDDRGELYGTGDPKIWPGVGHVDTYRFSAGLLAMLGDPAAPMMHKYARDAKTALDALGRGAGSEWIDFIFWDPAAPEADYSNLPLSYLASGVGGVTARSDWSASATFMSFISAPYINSPSAGHEEFDKGSPAFERNKNPLLVNPGAWLTHEPFGDQGWTLKYDDQLGNWDLNHDHGNRSLNNTFQVRQLDGQGNPIRPFGQSARQRSDGARTTIGRYEDGGSYVLTVGQFLEDMYYSTVTSLSRQIVYLRPSQFIVYDRSVISDKAFDQYEAFHFPTNPVEVAAPAPGSRRFDVNPGLFAGSMTTILPANAAIVTSDRLNNSTEPKTWNKVWRTEVRPTDTPAADRRWMTVFDLAPSPNQVSAASEINVTMGAAVGTLLHSPTGNSVVVCGTAPVGTAIAGPVAYVVPAAQTRHVITDLDPSAGYTISVGVSNGAHSVSILAGGNKNASANGVITFAVSPSGEVTP